MGQSVAFKCTYNDGGEGAFVGFSATCSKDNIERNVKSSRVWCSSPQCECRQFYDTGMQGEKPEDPCYESRLFRDWRYGAGWFHTGVKAGTPIHLRKVEVDKFAILTTRFPGEPEEARRIIGLYQIGEILQIPETVLVAVPKGRVRLPMEEAKELFFWAYHRTVSGKPDWRTGLVRYLDDGQVHRILADVAATVRDESTKKEINYLIAQVSGDTLAPRASGHLSQMSASRPTNIAKARKYGLGGEGEEHKKLKKWLSEHPERLGLTDVTDVAIEHTFLSGDSADVVFTHESGRYTVVEVETTNPLPGAYQAIKYRALLCAEKGLDLDTPQVRAILVAWSIPDEAWTFCERYGIDIQSTRVDG
jgi:hypothetical protein